MIVREATGGTTTQIYFQYDLTEVFIDSISWGGAAGGGKPSESLSVSAKSLVVTYWPQNSDGSLGAKIPKGWNADHERSDIARRLLIPWTRYSSFEQESSRKRLML